MWLGKEVHAVGEPEHWMRLFCKKKENCMAPNVQSQKKYNFWRSCERKNQASLVPDLGWRFLERMNFRPKTVEN